MFLVAAPRRCGTVSPRPAEGETPQYLIKNRSELHERVVGRPTSSRPSVEALFIEERGDIENHDERTSQCSRYLSSKIQNRRCQRKWDTDTIRANKPWLRSKSI